MDLNYKKMMTSSFISKIKSQPTVTSSLLSDVLYQCIQSSSFSTLPYFFYEMDSINAIHHTHSGNCVALSLFIQQYLQREFNIDSYLIPASIPNKFKRPGYLFISHVALAVPRSKRQVFVLDPAFYFMQPMNALLQHGGGSKQTIRTSNIYTNELETIEYMVGQTTQLVHYNHYQSIKKGIYFIQCHYLHDSHDSWQYFLTEILNPDEAVSNFFLNIIHPFITTTIYDEDKELHKLHVHIKFNDDGSQVTIKIDDHLFFDGPPHQMSKKQLSMLRKQLGTFHDDIFFQHSNLIPYFDL
jgi:hypothetical protein